MLLVNVREDPRNQQTSCTVQSGDFDIYEGSCSAPLPASVKGPFLEWHSAQPAVLGAADVPGPLRGWRA